MRKIYFAGAIIILAILCYFWFEPVFVYAFGWEALPENQNIPQETVQTDPEFLSEINKSQQILSEVHSKTQAPAVSVAVGIRNKIIWAEARGFCDLKNMKAAGTETTFRIGSVSKALTSVALGKMLEQDRLSLEDSAGKYIPYFSHPGVTIRQLASHMSGIRNYGLCFCFPVWEYYNNDPYESTAKSVAVFDGDPLLFEPGTSYSYSTYNYTLLSAVLEEASGKDFLTLMDEEVFSPLGMIHTTGDYADSTIETRATFYEVSEGDFKESYPVDNSNKWAGGGIISTPTDLVKLGNALLSGTLLKKETADTLFTPQTLADGTLNPEHYGLGWRRGTFDLFEGKKKVKVIHHGGTAAGSTALLILIPEYQLSVAMVMNKQSQSFTMFEYILPIAEQFILRMQENEE